MNFFPSDHNFLDEDHPIPHSQNPSKRCVVQTSKSNIKGQNTRSDENHDLICFRLPRNDSASISSIDISFQKNFLAQHIQAVSLIAQKPKESMPPMNLPQQLLLNEPQFHTELSSKNPECHSTTIVEALVHGSRMSHEEFIKDLRKQKDLCQFIDHLVGSYQKEVARSLIIVAADVWSEVRLLCLKELEIKDFRRRASTFSKRYAKDYSQRAQFCCLFEASQKSNFIKASQDRSTKFRKIIEIYATTILLIVGGFFENPYAGKEVISQGQEEVDYPKRQFSNVSLGFLSYQDLFSESQFFLEPQKKVKKE